MNSEKLNILNKHTQAIQRHHIILGGGNLQVEQYWISYRPVCCRNAHNRTGSSQSLSERLTPAEIEAAQIRLLTTNGNRLQNLRFCSLGYAQPGTRQVIASGCLAPFKVLTVMQDATVKKKNLRVTFEKKKQSNQFFGFSPTISNTNLRKMDFTSPKD